MKVTLRFDGGCTDNGLPTARATYGWQVLDQDNRLVAEGHGPVLYTFVHTNNVAEFAGMIEGLKWLVCLRPGIEELVIEGDSKFVLEAVMGNWRVKKPHLKSLLFEARHLISTLCCSWQTSWIPRERNDACDQLAHK